MKKRTAKDEYQYDEELRRESDIKREVIAHLRQQNRELMEDRKRLLDALLHMGEAETRNLAALAVYRQQVLESTRRRLEEGAPCCSYGCAEHVWDTVTGWMRRSED